MKKQEKIKRKFTRDEQDELERYLDDTNNPFSFEKYCGSCDRFNTDECPFRSQVTSETEWKKIKCELFFD